MKLKEIKDLDLVRRFIVEDEELWERVSEDSSTKESFIIKENPYFWWIGCYNENSVLVGFFWLHHINDVCLQIHAHVKKEYRKDYAYECGKGVIEYFVNKMPKNYQKLVAEIPVIYPDVIKFTEKFGFVFEGVNKLSCRKNKKVIDQNRYGLIRSDIKI